METVISAAIAAVPATIAAVAAMKAANSTKTNGSKKTVGQLAEATYDELKHLRQDLEVHRTTPAERAHRED
jgi:hypothetical protein